MPSIYFFCPRGNENYEDAFPKQKIQRERERKNFSLNFEIGFPQNNTIVGGIFPYDAHSGYLRRSAAVLRVVDFDVLVVHLPEQAVQFLFVLPVPVEHQRDDGQHQQQRAGHDR